MSANPNCPQCGKLLEKVRYPSDSMLNRDQWDSIRAGDWWCTTCPDNGRGATGAYFWENELAKSEAPAEPPCEMCGEPVTDMEEHLKNHQYRIVKPGVSALLPAKELDNCQICEGRQGGVLGNENIIDGIIVCDYCTVIIDRYKELREVTK